MTTHPPLSSSIAPVFWLRQGKFDTRFPPVEDCLPETGGLLACGGDLSPERLLDAYHHGIFPWFEHPPILWWSPPQRCVLYPDAFHISRSLYKTLRQGHYQIGFNRCFQHVVHACGKPRSKTSGSWIGPAMEQAYCVLNTLGKAHSIEVWMQGQLAGGLYGLICGNVFCGESMFSQRRDASKIALAHLVQIADAQGLALIDCQISSPHLVSLGACTIPRDEFLHILRSGPEPSNRPRWPTRGWRTDWKDWKNRTVKQHERPIKAADC